LKESFIFFSGPDRLCQLFKDEGRFPQKNKNTSLQCAGDSSKVRLTLKNKRITCVTFRVNILK
jgi:hypothetical protein